MSLIPTVVLAIPFAFAADAPSIEDSLTAAADTLTLDDNMEASMAYVDSVENSFTWQTGEVKLDNGVATLNIPSGFKFLDAEQSARVLVDHWGNPDAGGTLGMIFPESDGVLSEGGFAFVVSYEEMGFVEDDDADDIDYDEMMSEFKKEDATDNQQRALRDFPPVYTIGWAAPPFYDKDKKVLHWAKELQFGDSAEVNTLNYNVRVLGRKGVLQLNAVSTMEELENVKANIPGVLAMAQFNDGFRYDQFDDNTDQVAALTVGGLVAGKVLAKVGLFAFFGKFIKIILIAIAAGGAAVWRFLSGRKKRNEVPEGGMIIKP
ncbi:MAG: DUF2167 domain-containing protein [Flavobacteriales bacterium]